MLRLQRTAGNRAVGRLLRRSSPARPGARQRVSRWPVWPTAERTDEAYQAFVGMVAALRAAKRGPTESELAQLTELRDAVAMSDPSGTRLLELEREVVLWPRQVPGMDGIIEIVTGASDGAGVSGELTDWFEAAKARFDDATGGTLKDALTADARRYTAGASCLNYLYGSGLTRLFAGSPDEVAAAKARYREGAEERLAVTERHAKTLSRLAQELRTAGLVGPVRLIKRHRGRYRPPPTAHFAALSSAGPGWYFFLASVGSFHTLIVAVHATDAGRTYYKIQDGGTTEKTAEQLDEYIEDYGRIYGASSRIWPVYAAGR